jgi:hypothetical protein
VLIQFAPAPTDWVFGVLTAVFLLAPAVVLLLPESSPRLPGAAAALRPQVHVPPSARPAFLVALPCLIANWSIGGLFAALGPSLVSGVFGVDNHLVGGLLILALNGTGVLGSVALRRAPGERALVSGALVFAVGVTGIVASIGTRSVSLLFIAAVVSGFGFGAAFLGVVATVTRGVDAGHRAGLLAAIFVVGYLAFSVPSIVAGIAVGVVGLARTAEIYGVLVVALTLLALGGLLRQRRAAGGSSAQEPVDAEALAA